MSSASRKTSSASTNLTSKFGVGRKSFKEKRRIISYKKGSSKSNLTDACATSPTTPLPVQVAPQKERWLLTRKTWKYMTDAGRRLIPPSMSGDTAAGPSGASASSHASEIRKIEEYFQQVCRNEQRFVLWRRKSSYPGAMGASGNAGKHSHHHSVAMAAAAAKQRQHQLFRGMQTSGGRMKLPPLDKCPAPSKTGEDDEAAKTRDQIIELLQQHFQTPDETNESTGPVEGLSQSTRAQQLNITSKIDEIQKLLDNLQRLTRQQFFPHHQPWRITPDVLENKALLRKIYAELKQQQLHRILGRHPMGVKSRPATVADASTSTGIIAQQRSHYSSTPHLPTGSSRSTSVQNLFSSLTRRDTGKEPEVKRKDAAMVGKAAPSTGTKTKSSASTATGVIPRIAVRRPAEIAKKQYTTTGTQTDFIQLHVLQRMAKEYEQEKREEAAQQAAADAAQSPDEDSKSDGGGQQPSSPTGTPQRPSRRKSSIDNEDVSQSVSDTIKRYLRMARKKSVHDDKANRFKRVNYDRNLRNIRAKGEINPPGMDEGGDTKATQTLDAWTVLHLEHIRGVDDTGSLQKAHSDWRNDLEQRQQRQRKYLESLQLQQSSQLDEATVKTPPSPSPSSASTTSAMGDILHSGQQFLSNLWHGSYGSNQASTNSNNQSVFLSNNNSVSNLSVNSCSSNSLSSSANTLATLQKSTTQDPNQWHFSSNSNSGNKDSKSNTDKDMQKSKSQSNVGQFVSRRMWKSRSRSQTRPQRTASGNSSTTNYPEWEPQGNCVWISASSGRQLQLNDTRLQELTEIERKCLHRIAVDRINQLNLGVKVTPPGQIDGSSGAVTKQKRRPLLIKRKALTTSFFDTSGKKDSNDSSGVNSSSGRVFGVSLEKCLDNDIVLRTRNTGGGGSSSGGSVIQQPQQQKNKSERGSRNSFSSLLGNSSGGSSASSYGRGARTIGSCESLPTTNRKGLVTDTDILSVVGDNAGRRNSYDDDNNPPSVQLGSEPPMVSNENRSYGPQVPAVVRACIRHLEDHGLNTVGIFRVSTSKKRVRQLKEDFDSGDLIQIDAETCPHDVATILKEYLRDLPEPLLCRSLYKAFVRSQKIRNRRLQLEALGHLVQLLPVAHRDTLYVLLRFLAKMARFSDDVTTRDGSTTLVQGNKMDSNNLATVFAPNILRCSYGSGVGGSDDNQQKTAEQEIDEQIDVINVIRAMIDHYEDLFRVPAETMDKIYLNMMEEYPQQLNYICERKEYSGVSSPPLTTGGGLFSHQYIDSDLTDGSSTASTTATSSAATTPLHSPPPQQSAARKIYLREDFLHGNTVKGDTAAALESGVWNTTTTNSAVAARRRRKEQTRIPGPALNNNSDDSPNSAWHSNNSRTSNTRSASISSTLGGNQQKTATDQRRLSSPQQYQQQQQQQQPVGILKARLTIPVQMADSSKAKSKAAIGLDLFDIPYIEDGSGLNSTSGEISSNRNNKFLPSKQRSDSAVNLMRTSANTRKNSATGNILIDDLRRDPTGSSSGKFGSPASSSVTSPSAVTVQHFEPKFPPSISNIGGAVLRSKTADFERILQQQNTRQMSRNPAAEFSHESTIGQQHYDEREQFVGGQRNKTATTTSAPQQPLTKNVSRRQSGSSGNSGPIYKRQDVISSVPRLQKH